jgi:glycosyltransferase involved in cell wall biosynthesis
MATPLVSILVPCYNASPYLAECLTSAIGQTYTNVEVIVVDDGSTDDSLALARTFESNRLRVIAQANGGQAVALNTAIDAAQGEYLQFLDADDVLASDKIGHQIDRLSGEGNRAVATGAWARFAGSVQTASFTSEMVWRDLDPVAWHVESWRGGGMMHVAGWLIPRAIATDAGPWPEQLRWAANLDAHFFTRAALMSEMCLFSPNSRTFYRSGHAAMSGWKGRRSREASLQVVIDCGEALLSSETSERTRGAFADNLQRFVYSVYPEHFDLVHRAEERIRLLGGSRLEWQASPALYSAARITGWKTCRLAQASYRKVRYGKI